MPKFFRNFRIKSIELSKVKNYLLYAVGKIILVVAGILIAVKVGDIHEQRKKEQDFKAALKLVERDLHLNIAAVNGGLESWSFCDSIADLAPQGQVTQKELLKDNLLSQVPIIFIPDVHFH